MEYLETTVDKFIFRVAADRLYSSEGIWVKEEGSRVRLGLSDFIQQRSGDIAFVELAAAGARLAVGQPLGNIETIKVDFEVPAPVSGVVSEVNSELEMSPEVINQDPYEAGWLAVIEVENWPEARAKLMDAAAYFVQMKREAEEEAQS
jgi:glycine cleavage system H protein